MFYRTISARYNWPLIGCLLGLLAGCVTLAPNPARMESVQPALIFLPPTARQLVLLNRFDAAQLPYSKDRKILLLRDGAAQALSTAQGRLAADGSFPVAYRDTLIRATATGAFLLPAAEVQAYCRRWQAAGLLTLNRFEAYMRQDEVIKEISNNGYTSKTAAYSLVVRTDWTLYAATGQVLDQSVVSTARPYQQRAVLSGLLAAGPALAEAGDQMRELAAQAGTDYAQRYFPARLTLEREYYATPVLAPGHWQEAISSLKALTTNANTSLASRAAYNLSVAYEALADLEEAQQWATKAHQLRGTAWHLRRVQELQQRQEATAAWQAQRRAVDATQQP